MEILLKNTSKNAQIWKFPLPNPLLSLGSYYPFGMVIEGRSASSGDQYRYGFNGQEAEKDISGNESHTSAEFWMYDSRVGRRWNLDPVFYPSISNYACLLNNPIFNTDVYGDSATANESSGKVYSSSLKNGGKNFMVIIVNPNKESQMCNSEYFSSLENTGWDYVVVDNVIAADQFMTQNLKEGMVDNLIIRSHSAENSKTNQVDGVVTAWTPTNQKDEHGNTIYSPTGCHAYELNNKSTDPRNIAFKHLFSFVSSTATITFGSCDLGRSEEFSNELFKMIGKKGVTIYAMNVYSQAEYAMRTLAKIKATPMTSRKMNNPKLSSPIGVRITNKSGSSSHDDLNLIILINGGVIPVSQSLINNILNKANISSF